MYQDLALVDVRDVASNIYLNIEPTWFGIFINFKKLYSDAREFFSRLRISIPSLKVNVGELSWRTASSRRYRPRFGTRTAFLLAG